MTRDPGRIDLLLDALRELWHRQPDARLGQMISNLAPDQRDPFYIEDDVMLGRIREQLGKDDQDDLLEPLDHE